MQNKGAQKVSKPDARKQVYCPLDVIFAVVVHEREAQHSIPRGVGHLQRAPIAKVKTLSGLVLPQRLSLTHPECFENARCQKRPVPANNLKRTHTQDETSVYLIVSG